MLITTQERHAQPKGRHRPYALKYPLQANTGGSSVIVAVPKHGFETPLLACPAVSGLWKWSVSFGDKEPGIIPAETLSFKKALRFG